MSIRTGQTAKRLMITGGGTAGHVYPALAVLKALERRTPELVTQWVGSERSEAKLLPAAGVDFHQIDIRFSYRLPTPKNWAYYRAHICPMLLGKPFRQAAVAVEAFRPDLVLATGGYVSLPVLQAAYKHKIPIALISLDTVPGRVNWHFAEHAWRVFTPHVEAYEQFDGRCPHTRLRVVGYPARRPDATRTQVLERHQLREGTRLLLAMAGSLGAGAVHAAVGDFVARANDCGDPRMRDLAVIHVAGERRELLSDAVDGDAVSRGPVEYRPVGYLNNALDELCQSNWYIGRCGASTLGELINCGIPSLLIPDTQHRDHQQYYNAEMLVKRQQATLIEEDFATGEVLLKWVLDNWDTPKLPPPETPAAELIADELYSFWRGA